MQFAIPFWRAVSPYHQTHEDWQKWIALGQKSTGLVACEVDLSFLSAIKRRRLSSVARLMFAAAWPLLAEHIHCPLVFVSHDGEVNRSFALWQSFLQHEELSPTSFALSVHNAIAGQWSLMRADMSENVALSAKCNGLEIGITEAYGLLQEGAEQVLVVVVDEPIKHEYEVIAERAPFPLALALVITRGDQTSLNYLADAAQSTLTQGQQDISYYTSTIAWIVQQLTGQTSRNQVDAHGVWQWKNNP